MIEYRNFLEENKMLMSRAGIQGLHMMTKEKSIDDKAPYLYEKWESIISTKHITLKVFE